MHLPSFAAAMGSHNGATFSDDHPGSVRFVIRTIWWGHICCE